MGSGGTSAGRHLTCRCAKLGLPEELHVYKSRRKRLWDGSPLGSSRSSWNARFSRLGCLILRCAKSPQGPGMWFRQSGIGGRTVRSEVSAPGRPPPQGVSVLRRLDARVAPSSRCEGHQWSVERHAWDRCRHRHLYLHVRRGIGITHGGTGESPTHQSCVSRTSASMVEVAGPKTPPLMAKARDGPQEPWRSPGEERMKVLNGRDTAWVWVYTPPGYEKEDATEAYPGSNMFSTDSKRPPPPSRAAGTAGVATQIYCDICWREESDFP